MSLDPTTSRALADIVGPSSLVQDPDVLATHAVDWTGRWRGRASALVRPRDAEQVAAVVVLAAAREVALVPQGGNTGLVGGSVPHRGEVILALGALDEVEVVRGPDGVPSVVAGAGATIAAVQAAARGAGRRYAVDWGARDRATVGGSIATDAGGLHVVGHGSTRAQVRGLAAVLGTGAVVSEGLRAGAGAGAMPRPGVERSTRAVPGEPISTVAPLDAGLSSTADALIGTEGTLGVVTGARLALAPLPAAVATARIVVRSWVAAVDAAGLLASTPGISAVEGYGAAEAHLVAATRRSAGAPRVAGAVPEGAVVLVAEVEGDDPITVLGDVVGGLAGVISVDVADSRPRRAGLWVDREAIPEAIARIGPHHKLDVGVDPARVAELVGEVGRRVALAAPGASTWCFGHLGVGNVHVNVTGVDPDNAAVDAAVLELVLELGGRPSAEHGVGVAKRDWVHRRWGAKRLASERRRKATFDPAGVLNPGVRL